MGKYDAIRTRVEPYRIGSIMELPDYPGFTDAFPAAMEFAFEEAFENGVIDRPVEFIHRVYAGQPWTDGASNRRAIRELVEEHNVLAIGANLSSDNAISVVDVVEHYKVPTFSISGTSLYTGDYAFQLSNGSLPDEPAFIAAYLKSRGVKTVCAVRDYPSRIGIEYTRFMEYACQVYGLELIMVGNMSANATVEDAARAFTRLKNSGADALVYLGFGEAAYVLNEGLAAADWNPQIRVATTAFVGATYNKDLAAAYEGWAGVDQYNEGNPRFTALRERYRRKKGAEMIANTSSSCGYDVGMCIALGLSRMEIITGESLAQALETLRMVPAVTGGPKTHISFGPRDHRGYRGHDYLCIRKMVAGRSVLEAFEIL